MENVDAGDEMLAVMRIKKDCRKRALEISVSFSLYILTFLKFNPFERDIFSIFFLYESYIDQIKKNPSVRKKK